MSTYTKRITLTETTEQEFQRRKDFWKRDKLIVDEDTLLTIIENPLYLPLTSENPVDDYVTLFKKLFKHPYSPKLCIKASWGWGKYFKKQLEQSDLVNLAGIAVAHPLKQNYLEVKLFRREIDPNVVAPAPFRQPVIEFVESEIDGQKAIVGYQVCFPIQYQHLFTLSTSRQEQNFTLVHGMWVP